MNQGFNFPTIQRVAKEMAEQTMVFCVKDKHVVPKKPYEDEDKPEKG